jgi:hypothetical protein
MPERSPPLFDDEAAKKMIRKQVVFEHSDRNADRPNGGNTSAIEARLGELDRQESARFAAKLSEHLVFSPKAADKGTIPIAGYRRLAKQPDGASDGMITVSSGKIPTKQSDTTLRDDGVGVVPTQTTHCSRILHQPSPRLLIPCGRRTASIIPAYSGLMRFRPRNA